MLNPLVLLASARTRTSNAIGHRMGLVQISLAAVLWGTTGVVVRRLHESAGLGSVAIGFYRLLAAALLLLILSGPRLRQAVAGLRSHPWSLLFAGVGLGVYQVLYFISVADVGVGVSTVVSLGIAPVVTVVIECARDRRWPGLRTCTVVGAAVAGLALVAISSSTVSSAAAPRPGIGLLAAVGSGLSYALTTVVSRRAAQGISPLVMTTTSSVIGALVLLPLALVSGAAFTITGTAVSELVYLGAATTVIAYALFYAGLRSTPSSVASVLTLIEPLTATVLAVILLSEPLPALTVVGGVLLLGAIGVLYLAPATAPEDDGALGGTASRDTAVGARTPDDRVVGPGAVDAGEADAAAPGHRVADGRVVDGRVADGRVADGRVGDNRVAEATGPVLPR